MVIWSLIALQLVCLGLFTREGLKLGRGWMTANMVFAGFSFAAIFLPSLIYAAEPSYLDVGNATRAVAIATLSLLAALAGYVLLRGHPTDVPERPLLEKPYTASISGTLIVFGIGLVALVFLMLNAGGFAAYLSRINETAGMNAGLFYVVAIALGLRFGPVALIFQRWALGRKAGVLPVLLLVAGVLLLGLTGARSFIAVAAVEIIFMYGLMRRRLPTGQVVVAGILVGVVLIFGAGALKRYGNYTDRTEVPRSLPGYLVYVAPGEFVDAYANNYLDAVRLMSLADTIVPSQAGYEWLRPIEQTLLKPVPSTLRPKGERAPAIRDAFEPPGDTAYAQPLQVTAFLAGGFAAVAFVFALLGAGIARLDGWLAARKYRKPWALAAGIMFVVQLPVLVRSGLPNGAAFLGVEVIGTAVATWFVGSRYAARIDRLFIGTGVLAWRAVKNRPRPAIRPPLPRPAWSGWALLGPAVVFAVSLLVSTLVRADTPVLAQDSLGYLAGARLLAGVGVVPQQAGDYYSFGYSLTLVPAYLLGTGWSGAYRAGFFVNALCLAIAAAGVYRIARSWYGASPRQGAFAAVATGLLPLAVLPSTYLWGESLLVALAIWWMITLRLWWERPPTPAYALTLIGLSLGLLATHTRMLPVLGATGVALVFVGGIGRRLRAGLVALLLSGAAFISAVDAWMLNQILLRTDRSRATSVLALGPADAFAVVTRMIGMSWAVTVGTLGFALVGALVVFRDRRRSRGFRLTLGLAVLGVLTISATFLQGADAQSAIPRLDWQVYERYLAPLAIALAGAGLSAFATKVAVPWKIVVAVTLGTSALTLLSFGLAPAGNVAFPNVPSTIALGSLWKSAVEPNATGLPLGITSAVLLAAVALIALAASRRPDLRTLCVTVLALVALISGARVAQAHQKFWDSSGRSIATVLERTPASYPVSFDTAPGFSPDDLNRLQLFADDRPITFFNSALGGRPASDLVVARPNWSQATRMQAAPITVEISGTTVLWRVGAGKQAARGRPAPKISTLLACNECR